MNPNSKILEVPSELFKEIQQIISLYPEARSAALPILHRLQEHFGWISKDMVEWVATQIGVQPIAIWELVTFYPMLRDRSYGKYHFKICRSLPCELAGSYELHHWLCTRLGLDPRVEGPQTTPDGLFTVEFVECLAKCYEAPLVLCNEEERGNVTIESLSRWLDEIKCSQKEET